MLVRFSIQKLTTVECSGNMQIKFCDFCVQVKCSVTFLCSDKILRVFFMLQGVHKFFLWFS